MNKIKLNQHHIPNRDRILQEGGLAKWHRAKR